MRTSNDEIVENIVKNGFDYEFQCWVKDFVIQRCGHREIMDCRCFGKKFEGKDIRNLKFSTTA